MPTKKNSEANVVHIDGETYEYDSLSPECRMTISKWTNIDGEIAKLVYEMEKSQLFKEQVFLTLKKQLPTKSLEDLENDKKPEKK